MSARVIREAQTHRGNAVEWINAAKHGTCTQLIPTSQQAPPTRGALGNTAAGETGESPTPVVVEDGYPTAMRYGMLFLLTSSCSICSTGGQVLIFQHGYTSLCTFVSICYRKFYDSIFHTAIALQVSTFQSLPSFDIYFASTMHVRDGIYTCSQFLRPFHSIGVVIYSPPCSTFSKPPNRFSSLLRTTLYFPGSSTPTR